MKLQCGPITVIIIALLCLAGGFGLGKVTQPITINQISNSQSTSISTSASMSGSILVNNERRVDAVVINMNSTTNIQVITISNGVTNVFNDKF